jgi:hypothetical protein
MMETVRLEGACCCRAVQNRLLSLPMFVNCCHCTDCQRHTGSAFVSNALIETDQIFEYTAFPNTPRIAEEAFFIRLQAVF